MSLRHGYQSISNGFGDHTIVDFCATFEPVVAVVLSVVVFEFLVAILFALAALLVRPFWCWCFGRLSDAPAVAGVPALVNISFADGFPQILASLLLLASPNVPLVLL